MYNCLNFKIRSLEFLLFFLAFIAFTIIGTLSHELAHFITAKIRGFAPVLHYAHVSWGGEQVSRLDNFWIGFSGPFQTMAFGSIAFMALLSRRLREESKIFSFADWLLVFFSLFWLRQVFNLLTSIYSRLIDPSIPFFGGDEAYLSIELGFPEGFLSLITAGFGTIICLYVWLRIVPKTNRFTFFLSGIFGSGIGWWLWTKQLGPYLLP